MLDNIVNQAQITAGVAPAAVHVASPENTAGLDVIIVQQAAESVQARFCTVQTGDGLGAISIKFIGSTEFYAVIFEANKGLLPSPDRIRVDQRLVIPQGEA